MNPQWHNWRDFNEEILKVKELLEIVVFEALIIGVRGRPLWKNIYALPDRSLLKVKQVMKNHIRVEDVSVLQYKTLYFHKDNWPKKPYRQNHSLIWNSSFRNNMKRSSHDHQSYPERFSTPLNINIIEVYTAIKGKEFVQYPTPMKVTPYTCTSNKYCMFHWDKRYDMK